LKNSCFVETTENWEIGNVYQSRDCRFYGFVAQRVFGDFRRLSFCNSHAWSHQLYKIGATVQERILRERRIQFTAF